MLGEQLGAPMLVRTLETLGQAVVDMRGTDAADPRLVLEIALVRLARREAGTPRAGARRARRPARTGAAAPTASARRRAGARRRRASDAPAARSGRSFAELRRRSRRTDPAPPAGVAAARATGRGTADRLPSRADTPADAARSTPAGEVDIDDVIVAWAEILPELPPATRAAVREAQPLAVDDGVITFGVPKAHYETALPRFQQGGRQHPRPRCRRSSGRRMMFKPVAARRLRRRSRCRRAAAARRRRGTSRRRDARSRRTWSTRPRTSPAVDSVSLITQSLGATVVEEVPATEPRD